MWCVETLFTNDTEALHAKLADYTDPEARLDWSGRARASRGLGIVSRAVGIAVMPVRRLGRPRLRPGRIVLARVAHDLDIFGQPIVARSFILRQRVVPPVSRYAHSNNSVST